MLGGGLVCLHARHLGVPRGVVQGSEVRDFVEWLLRTRQDRMLGCRRYVKAGALETALEPTRWEAASMTSLPSLSVEGGNVKCAHKAE